MTTGAMDAVELARKLKEEATCSICLDYFTDPVMTSCGHNFCRECIQTSWEKAKGKKGRRKRKDSFPCPECRETSPHRNLRPNRMLTKVAEMARQHPGLQRRDLCPLHQEALKLFCEEDRSPICVVCREAKEHRLHRALPVDEAAQEYKLKLEKDMEYLRQEMCKTGELQAKEEQALDEWQNKVRSRRERIVREFEKVGLCLLEEERRLLQALKKEEEETAGRLQESKALLARQSHALERLLLQLEDLSQREPLHMLQDIKDPLGSRAQDCVQGARTDRGAQKFPRGRGARPRLGLPLPPPVREPPEALPQLPARKHRVLQQGQIPGLPLRRGPEHLLLGETLLGGGHEPHRGRAVGPGRVQRQREPQGQGPQVPRERVLGGAAVQGHEVPVHDDGRPHACDADGATQPHGRLPGLRGRGGLLLQRERRVPPAHLLPGRLPRPAAALLLPGGSQIWPDGHLHGDRVGEGVDTGAETLALRKARSFCSLLAPCWA
ncbi:E3 ubiquitin-protein ligase TRIM17 isoform X1 [Microcebus murinus]|uniref:E3 ubiquitin-protein ligase TRIM17 isoform X1 n=1 Tax=Microcebus murinus TaxID=30608 RepID=UPI003F6CF55D